MAEPERPQSVLAGWIGGMTMLWNDCQAVVFMMFHLALGSPLLKSKAVFFTLNSDNMQRMVTAAIIKQALYLHPDLSARVVRAINDLGQVAGRRNDFIHAIWHFPSAAETGKVWLDARKSLEGKDPVDEIRKLMDELQAMFLRLRSLKVEVEKALAEPKNALRTPMIPGLLVEPPPQPDEQRASLTQGPPQDDPEVPPPRRPASQE